MKYKRCLLFSLLVWFLWPVALGQRSALWKLSPMLRTMKETRQSVCAFIRISSDADEVLRQHGARSLASFGNIHIASIPVRSLRPLSVDRRVQRIEANRGHRPLNHEMAFHLNASPAYQGAALPQAYTGQGVVVGVMDVGFDLTHPTFYSRDTTTYRVARFWDMLDLDTLGSLLPVGRDYGSPREVLAHGHSRDGLDLSHGTHTAGTAAGSGYDSPYQGIAPESTICLVANAVTDDLPFISEDELDNYTYATDALGFKYMFDYAQAQGLPCVASFSEGSLQDFYGYDQLYYEVLDSLTGPGRLIVASAGNKGHVKTWFPKPWGMQAEGCFLRSSTPEVMVTVKTADDLTLRLVAYTPQGNDTLALPLLQTTLQPDSLLQLEACGLNISVEAYPSCYEATETCYDVQIVTADSTSLGNSQRRVSVELVGREAEGELHLVSGLLVTNDLNPQLQAGLTTCNIHSPGSAPSVICVGATTWRDSIVNESGETMRYWGGTGGRRAEFSSVGPTLDGRMKPDVVAPGNNIVSSFSSYYMAEHPDASDLQWNVATFPFGGRTYAWTASSGTSMSCPAVAGGIALWLQACPTLSPQDVIDIMARTCRHNDPQLSYPNNEYGYGEMDVYAGLLDILGLSGISEVAQNHTRAEVALHGNQLTLLLPRAAEKPCSVRLLDLGGRSVLTATLPAGQTSCQLRLPALTAGVYVLCLGNDSPAPGSTLIRLNNN